MGKIVCSLPKEKADGPQQNFFENFFEGQVSFLDFRVAMGGCEVKDHFRHGTL